MSKTKRRNNNKAAHAKDEFVTDVRPGQRTRNRPMMEIPAGDRDDILVAKFHSDNGPKANEHQSFQRRAVRRLRHLGRAFLHKVTRNPEYADAAVPPSKHKEARVVGQ